MRFFKTGKGQYGEGDEFLGVKVRCYKAAKKDLKRQAEIVEAYFGYTDYINNWDLVDLTCYELLGDWYLSRDLIHKAVGWMLREVGKRDRQMLERFLLSRYRAMPRTMLRYAIEKFPKSVRQKYLKGKV